MDRDIAELVAVKAEIEQRIRIKELSARVERMRGLIKENDRLVQLHIDGATGAELGSSEPDDIARHTESLLQQIAIAESSIDNLGGQHES